jgi:hypothetical protein
MTRLQMSVLRCGQQTANNLRTPMIVLAWITEGLRPGRWCAPDTLRWRRIFLAYWQAEQDVGVLWSGLGLAAQDQGRCPADRVSGCQTTIKRDFTLRGLVSSQEQSGTQRERDFPSPFELAEPCAQRAPRALRFECEHAKQHAGNNIEICERHQAALLLFFQPSRRCGRRSP